MTFRTDPRVALTRDLPVYSSAPPYHPSEAYPEWAAFPVSAVDNPAYRSVRNLFNLLELDATRAGSVDWNPLGALVRPGDTVVIKPNLVSHANQGASSGLTDTDSLVTHGSVIRAVVDYTAKALGGGGRILVADCPVQGTDWDKLLELIAFDALERHVNETFPGIEIKAKDYRLGRAVVKNGAVVERILDERERHRYLEVDLKRQSLLIPLMKGRYGFGVAQYPRSRMRQAHTPESNTYLFPRDILEADVVINLPKMKTHMKAGMTGALKNLVGINGHKDYLPHFRFGSPRTGGDEYPDGNWLWDLMWLLTHAEWELERGQLKKLFIFLTRVCATFLPVFSGLPRGAGAIGGGSWYGNDTLWRTLLDINRAFFYLERSSGQIGTTPSEHTRYFAIMDGLVMGQKESPLLPTPRPGGVMLAAFNPLAMDAVAGAMMGLDVRKLKQITEGFKLESLPLVDFLLEQVRVVSSIGLDSVAAIYEQKAYVACEPSRGYKGHIEFAK